MRFASELVRHLFHELPTDKQVEFSRLEQQLAEAGSLVQIDSVMPYDDKLDMVIRITGKLHPNGIATD